MIPSLQSEETESPGGSLACPRPHLESGRTGFRRLSLQLILPRLHGLLSMLFKVVGINGASLDLNYFFLPDVIPLVIRIPRRV